MARARFVTRTTGTCAAAPADEFYARLARQAYVKADMDTIRTIRRLAQEQGFAA